MLPGDVRYSPVSGPRLSGYVSKVPKGEALPAVHQFVSQVVLICRRSMTSGTPMIGCGCNFRSQ
jgi:hypothetical protein